jgi:bifunctional non-homologous end joining protein LigD
MSAPGTPDQTLKVTHPDKPYWPEDGLTKADMIDHYRQIGPLMLPYFRDRPVTLRLFPRGIHEIAFWRRELPPAAPDWLRHVRYHTRSNPHPIELPLIDSVDGLLYLANLGSIEFHLWASRSPRLDRPDWAVFDLDPGESASFTKVLQAALQLRELLRQQDLQGYPKTSGASGLHILVPGTGHKDFDSLRAWVRTQAERLAAEHPALFALPARKTHSGRHIHIDYRQNAIGRNTAAPYSLRGLPGAPVSTPLSWTEIGQGNIKPADFNIRTLPERLKAVGDLYAPLLEQLP